MNRRMDHFVRKWIPRIAGICLGVLVVNVLAYAFGVARLGKMATEEGIAAQSEKRALEEKAGKSRNTADQVRIFQEGRTAIDTLTRDYLKTRSERMTEAQRTIRKLLSESGLACDGIAYSYDIVPKGKGRETPPRQYLRMNASFRASGSYPQIKSFLAGLQASPQFFTMEEMSLSSSTQGAVLLNMSAKVSSYFLAAPGEEPPSGDAS